MLSQRPEYHDLILWWIKERVAAGERAPFNHEIRGGTATLQNMLRRGLISRIEVYGKNWRVIQLPDGSRTAEPPFSNLGPYRTFSRDG